MLKNELTNRINLDYPIIQAPMAGGITTSRLVSVVSNNGALGMIGAGYLSPIQLRNQIKEVKLLTANNFGVNLFVPNDFEINEQQIEVATSLLKPYREALQVQEVAISWSNASDAIKIFDEQIQVIIEEKVPICSFTFGIPPIDVIQRLKHQGIVIIGTATTVIEAIAIEKIGMDVVVVQGSEAGGHRGNFISTHEESLISLMSLIPQVVDHVRIPVIAAGGIMDNRGLMDSLHLGASAVQMGTAFLTCEESGALPVHKEAIIHAKEGDTTFTRAFSGKWARGISNQFVNEMKDFEQHLPEFPIQNTLTQSIRKAAATQNNKEFMSLWSGQNSMLAKKETVESLIHRMVTE